MIMNRILICVNFWIVFFFCAVVYVIHACGSFTHFGTNFLVVQKPEFRIYWYWSDQDPDHVLMVNYESLQQVPQIGLELHWGRRVVHWYGTTFLDSVVTLSD